MVEGLFPPVLVAAARGRQIDVGDDLGTVGLGFDTELVEHQLSEIIAWYAAAGIPRPAVMPPVAPVPG